MTTHRDDSVTDVMLPTLRYLVPSRGRPANVRRLWQAWCDTDAIAELVVALDRDDAKIDEYFDDHTIYGNRYTIVVSDPLGNLGPILNAWAPQLARNIPSGRQADALGFMGDDHVPQTYRWDQELYVSLQPHGIVYGNDLLQRANLPTAVMLDSDIVRKLGWLVPPGLRHMYMDNFWLDLGIALGTLTYRDDVIIEHRHPVAGKADQDDTYRATNTDEIYTADAHTYRQFVNDGGIGRAVEAIRG